MKPLLLVDVDGPLNPYAQSNNQLRKGKQFHLYKLLGYKVWLNRWHGEELMKLTDVYDLVWATTWEHDANSLIGPRIGLEKLPVIEFDKTWKPPSHPDGTYFKTHDIVKYVKGRPFAWVDDEVSTYDMAYVQENHPAPAYLCHVSPMTGLTQEHFTRLRKWAERGMREREA